MACLLFPGTPNTTFHWDNYICQCSKQVLFKMSILICIDTFEVM